MLPVQASPASEGVLLWSIVNVGAMVKRINEAVDLLNPNQKRTLSAQSWNRMTGNS